MLLKQLLESPIASSSLVVADPFKTIDRDSLLKDVIGLANAKVDGPRHILFGVNPSGVDGSVMVGIPEDAIADLKRAHRLVSSFVEPGLALAFIFDSINGKLVGALQIDGCDYGPYFLAHDLSEDMQRGACWVREGRELLQVERNILVTGNVEAAVPVVQELTPENASLSIGFDSDAENDFLELEIPDTSDPPFSDETDESGTVTHTPLDFTQTIAGKILSKTARLLKTSADKAPAVRDAEDTQNLGMKVADAARKHYYLEDRAAKVDIFIRNGGNFDASDLTVEIGIPRLPGFEVAHRLYPNPFNKGSEAELRRLRYPDVSSKGEATIVRTTVDSLPAVESRPLFRTPLRIAVGPEAQGRKVAIKYQVRGPDGQRLLDGRLKLRLGHAPKSNPAQADQRTHIQTLDEEAV